MPTNRKAEIAKLSLYKPPARSEIQDAVQRLNKENKMADRFWAIIIYVVVMILLLVVCSGQQINNRFLQTLSVKNIFVGKTNVNMSFHKVCGMGGYKRWTFSDSTDFTVCSICCVYRAKLILGRQFTYCLRKLS